MIRTRILRVESKTTKERKTIDELLDSWVDPPPQKKVVKEIKSTCKYTYKINLKNKE